jgi:hypothetical protein
MMNTGAVVKWMGVVIFMVDGSATDGCGLRRRASAAAAAKNEKEEMKKVCMDL